MDVHNDTFLAPLAAASATPEARLWLRRLRDLHGPLVLHQSHGCCDGSAPLLLAEGEFRLGEQDQLLARLDGVPLYVHRSVLGLWRSVHLVLDVVEGGAGGFSLEVPEGIRFQTRTASPACPRPAERPTAAGTTGDARA